MAAPRTTTAFNQETVARRAIGNARRGNGIDEENVERDKIVSRVTSFVLSSGGSSYFLNLARQLRATTARLEISGSGRTRVPI